MDGLETTMRITKNQLVKLKWALSKGYEYLQITLKVKAGLGNTYTKYCLPLESLIQLPIGTSVNRGTETSDLPKGIKKLSYTQLNNEYKLRNSSYGMGD